MADFVDFSEALGAVDREVVRGDDQITLRMRRRYDGSAADVWDAITTADRLARWFAPVSGDLREGGKFEVKDQAAGSILRCDPPRLLKVTYGGEASIVEVRLEADGDATALTLEHSVPLEFAGSGAGALFAGPGWDVAFLALGLHLAGEFPGEDDPAAWESTIEVQRYSRQVIDAWAEAASATATPEEIEGAKQAAQAQFTPDL
jgi:uncharacterized protein YndB with AHSA1/START domain